MDLFRRQIESIRAQTHRNWVCVISDDRSAPERFAELRDAVAGDERFVVSRSPRRLGFYANFERALSLVPADADHVAMADQDDEWRPEKLATLLERLGPAQLVYSDARIIERDGRPLSDTYWSRRANNHSDLLSMLLANAITGAASLFRRELLDYALPFPPAQFAHFHDHWIGLTALSLGDVAFVDEPLYDYVQHGEAALGHEGANRMTTLRGRLGALTRDPRELIRSWRMSYFGDACRLMQFATILELRCGDRMAPPKRAVLRRFLAADRSPRPLAALAGRGLRELVGRPETLGAEWLLLSAFAWRRLLAATTRDRPVRGLRLDSLPPPIVAPRPGERSPGDPVAWGVADKIAPLRLTVREDAPERINILIPTIDLRHFFGGYIGKLNLARRLSEHGLRVRLVTVDPVGSLPPSWRRTVESYRGLAGLFERVEVAFARESAGIEVSRDDRFIATTWWTAHIAREALRSLGGERFLYLIQEYEPFTFPMGTYAALARESYDFPHFALFSTELLRDYFRRHGIGVYAAGEAEGDAASAAFENAITAIDPPTAEELAGRAPRRLLFYARPEPHAARNMYELGALALGRALARGAFASGWELHGIGTVDDRRRVELGGGESLDLLPRSEQDDYAGILRRARRRPGADVHAASQPRADRDGLRRDADGDQQLREQDRGGHGRDLHQHHHGAADDRVRRRRPGAGRRPQAGDFERRARGSEVRWSRDWDRSFDDALLDRIESPSCGADGGRATACGARATRARASRGRAKRARDAPAQGRLVPQARVVRRSSRRPPR